MVNYFLLHGFLGTNHFFSKLISQLEQEPEAHKIFSPNLFSKNSLDALTPHYSFDKWANNFNKYVEQNSKQKNILIGYSMGGRLGVHAFMAKPELWESCYFISSNPGLIKSNEKMARMAWEDGWCYQIENKPWNEFIKLWNQQDVFKHSKDIKPNEFNFNKNLLKLALKNWSLTKHNIDLQLINNKKLHWLVGENDNKYQHIFKTLKNLYQCQQVSQVEGCGHRFEMDMKYLNYSSPGMSLI